MSHRATHKPQPEQPATHNNATPNATRNPRHTTKPQSHNPQCNPQPTTHNQTTIIQPTTQPTTHNPQPTTRPTTHNPQHNPPPCMNHPVSHTALSALALPLPLTRWAHRDKGQRGTKWHRSRPNCSASARPANPALARARRPGKRSKIARLRGASHPWPT